MSIQKGLVIADAHLSAGKKPHYSYELVKRFASKLAPWDWIIDLGDTLEMDYLASFNKDAARVIAKGDMRSDYDCISTELDDWQQLTDKYVMLQGNHDERVDRFIERYPFLDKTMGYEEGMGLSGRGVEYIPLIDQPYRMKKLFFCHGWYATKYAATTHLDKIGGNVIFGHVHKFQVASKVIPAKGEEIQAWSLGCLCGLVPEWKKGAPMGWQNGFAVVEMDDKSGFFNVYPVNIIGRSFIYGGNKWQM